MRKLALLAAATVLAAGPALAQQAPRHGAAQARPASRPPRTGEAPNDRGPFTPEANRAYQGGGVVLESAPGGPAPIPRATPPGQAPAGMVSPQ